MPDHCQFRFPYSPGLYNRSPKGTSATRMRNIPVPNNANHPTFLIRRFALSPEKRPYRFDKSCAAPTINYRIWKTNVQTRCLGLRRTKKRFLGAKAKVSRHPRERSPRRRSRFQPLNTKLAVRTTFCHLPNN